MKKLLLAACSLFFFLAAQAQVPNAGFEMWHKNPTFNTPEEPVSYMTYNVFKVALVDTGNPVIVYKDSTLKHSGNYSMKIITKKLKTDPRPSVIPDTSGVAATGLITNTLKLQFGFPCTTKYLNFSFWGAAAPVGSDVGYAVSVLTKWRGTYRDTIAIASTPFATSPGFVQYTVPYTYYDCCNSPDTASLFFSSSTKIGGQIGSTIWVDDVALNGINGINELDAPVRFQLYPNPANTMLTINTQASEVSEIIVHDITGRAVASQPVNEDRVYVDVSSFPPGMYFYTALSTDRSTVVTHGKFNVIR
jgi:hypothetical protein